MARLPIPGQDEGVWGEYLNDFLLQSHNDDGSLKSIDITQVDGLQSALQVKADDAEVLHVAGNQTVNDVKTFTVSPVVPTPTDANHAANKQYADDAANTTLAQSVTLSGNQTVGGVKTFTDTVYAQADIMADSVSMYQPLASPMNFGGETIISNFQAGHGFVKDSASGTQTDDTSTFARGNQSVRLTTNGLGGACFTTRTVSALNLTNKQFRLWLRVDDPSKVVQLFVYFSSDNLVGNWFTIKPSDDMAAFKPNVWTCVTMSQGRNAQVTGSPNVGAITSVRVRVQDNGTGPVNVWVGGLGFFSEPTRGIVSVTFDDNFASAYTHGKQEMDKYGFRGTMYAIPQRVGLANYMTLAQLHNMHDSGWDISNHTFDHINLTTLTADEIEYQCRKAKNWFRKNGFSRGLEDMALPQGGYNDDVVLPVVRKYFRSIRTIVNQVETIPPANHHKLRTLYVINSTTVSTVKTAIDNAIARKEWLIMVFHALVTGTPSDPIQWRTTDFAEIMAYLQQTQAVVRPVSEVLNDNSLVPY